jgi:tricorn protease
MRRIFLFLVVAVLTGYPFQKVQGEPLRLMRYPDIAYGKIVFCYQGDLWLVPQEGGRAIRLTVHDGVESYPKFSPDGKWIAFTGNYFGGTNVFIIPSGGGEPKQLTFEPSSAIAVGWTPDSQHVLFSSTRAAYSNFYTELFKVSIDGRLPQKLPVDRGSLASFSPDGKKMVFVRHPMTFWWWKRYRGSLNQDLWIYDFEKETFQRITDTSQNETWPMWGKDGKIYFVSDLNGIANLFTHDLDTQRVAGITTHSKGGVQWPSMSPDGRSIVYQNEGRLWRLDTETRITQEIVVEAPSDDHFNMVAFVNPVGFVRDWDVSPHARRIVLDARGKIFSVPVKTGDTRRLTKTLDAREQHPAWSPDGRWIAYVSDGSGEQEIYLMDQMGQGEPRQLTQSGKIKLDLSWSPDSKRLLFHTNDNVLYLLDVDARDLVTIARNPVTLIDDYSWSPDSRWVAYAYREKNFNSDIYLYDTQEKKSKEFLMGPTDDYHPVFTPDGKTLVFLSEPVPDQVEVRSVSLLPEEKQPYQKPEDEEEPDKEQKKKEDKAAAKDAVKGEEGKEEVKPPSATVKVEFERVRNRVRRLPLTPDLYRNLQATDAHYYFLKSMPKTDPDESPKRAGMTLYAFDLKELVHRRIADHVLSYQIAPKEKKLVFWDGEAFRILDANGKEGKPEQISLANLKLKVDRKAEWKQIFEECWRIIRDYFYDPNMHGVDWPGIREHYQAFLPYVRTRQELNLLLLEMVGEINASHNGVSGGDFPNEAQRYPVALLGAELEPDMEAGLYRFKKIYKGSHSANRFYAPLDADYVKIREGDYLLAVNGQRISAQENYLRYFVNQDQNQIELTTNRQPTPEGAILTKIKPITTDSPLRYRAWVEKNRERVEAGSNGKIGYFHLENMGENDLKEFKKWFEAYRYREAIIIDVRYNGGGYIDAQLIDMLERRPYQINRERNSVPLERPLEGFYGKVVVLCNEYSFSDAEVFPSGFKFRKLGTVIGKQTMGYVIAIRSYRLIDGGWIQRPIVGIWELDGTQLEGLGATPDIVVENTPEDELKGRDPQLEKAIDYLMEEIAKSPRNYDYPTPIKAR